MTKYLLLFSILICHATSHAQQKDKVEILKLAHQFFEALEKQDTLVFNKILMKNSYNYMLVEEKDSVRLVSRLHKNSNFVRPDRIIKERMRESEVIINIHKNIATVWAPYDLWINDKYSHCGVDVFIMMKGNHGWKIATISFSIEKEGCK